jgi:hypothetical protein
MLHLFADPRSSSSFSPFAKLCDSVVCSRLNFLVRESNQSIPDLDGTEKHGCESWEWRMGI